MAELSDEFIEDMVSTAGAVALFFVGVPDAQWQAALSNACANLEARLAQKFGADVAVQIAEAFCDAVFLRRRELELEAAGETPSPVLN
jgi:hypothetical protein